MLLFTTGSTLLLAVYHCLYSGRKSNLQGLEIRQISEDKMWANGRNLFIHLCSMCRPFHRAWGGDCVVFFRCDPSIPGWLQLSQLSCTKPKHFHHKEAFPGDWHIFYKQVVQGVAQPPHMSWIILERINILGAGPQPQAQLLCSHSVVQSCCLQHSSPQPCSPCPWCSLPNLQVATSSPGWAPHRGWVFSLTWGVLALGQMLRTIQPLTLPRYCCPVWAPLLPGIAAWDPQQQEIQHQMMTSVTRAQRCSSCPLQHPSLSEGDLQTTCLKCCPFTQVFASPAGRLWSLPGLPCRHTRGPSAVSSQSSWPKGWSETAVVPLLSWSFCVDQWVLQIQVHADSWAGRDDVDGEIQSYAWISSHRHQTLEHSSFSMSGGHAKEGELGVSMVPAQVMCSWPSPPG